MNSLIKPGDIYNFSKENFLTDYYDREGDSPYQIMIINNPVYGMLLFEGKVVNEKFVFSLEDVDNFKYIRLSKNEYTENIQFKISDNNINKLFSKMSTFTINVNAYVNEPPTIGDNEITINYNELKIFTIEDFTVNTTPPYNDNEGDEPYKLKILSLPSTGSLKYNNIDVTINQEILFSDIELGLLTIKGTEIDTNGETLSFDFTISDTGSQEYAS